MKRQVTAILSFLALSAVSLEATSLRARGGRIRLDTTLHDGSTDESIRIRDGGGWTPALSAVSTRVIAGTNPGEVHVCTIRSVSAIQNPRGILLRGDCGVGTIERRVVLTPEPDVLDVSLRFFPNPNVKVRSVEDRYQFAPGRRNSDTPSSGPLDFVWSQDTKNEADGIIPNWAFKSPVVMFQQGKVFAALMPKLDDRRSAPLALDLDVTSEAKPWFSYGAVTSQPYGHSYFRRSPEASLEVVKGTIQYSYSIVASAQPSQLGYRRAVRRLWAQIGHEQLFKSNDLQRNARRPELELFDDWRKEAWIRYANEVYRDFDCAGVRCGTLASMRNPWGIWDKPAPDAWFNSWFQTLRTAYGWSLFGRRTNNAEIQRKAETVLNLALNSPRNEGAFSTIYLLGDHRWIREDGWAGYPDDYHAFCMSWTAYWMLRWGKDLTPGRKSEILAFTRPYGDFLVKHQLASGVIPSWYGQNLQPRPEFREFNAETAGSAVFLLELARETGDRAYLDAATRAMDFVAREVLPRQRWFDFETFRSCARKGFGYYDSRTAQYPQNNLSTIQAAMAYLELFRATQNRKYLELGTHVLDYLLLTQQVWNNPAFSPKLVGGFTTQNTDAEWSDARQCYAAVLLWEYYQETGELEYLERAVAAARSTFAVAPWENWAHTGYRDEAGALTGFHWGTGSAMTSVEIMSSALGDAFINLQRKHGVGFNACSLRDLKIAGHSISFHLDAASRLQTLTVKFAGVDPRATYRIVWNDHPPVTVPGEVLADKGFVTAR